MLNRCYMGLLYLMMWLLFLCMLNTIRCRGHSLHFMISNFRMLLYPSHLRLHSLAHVTNGILNLSNKLLSEVFNQTRQLIVSNVKQILLNLGD